MGYKLHKQLNQLNKWNVQIMPKLANIRNPAKGGCGRRKSSRLLQNSHLVRTLLNIFFENSDCFELNAQANTKMENYFQIIL